MKELKINKIIELIAIALTIVAIVLHNEIITLIILAAGTAWCVGFIGSCAAKLVEKERYGSD